MSKSGRKCEKSKSGNITANFLTISEEKIKSYELDDNNVNNVESGVNSNVKCSGGHKCSDCNSTVHVICDKPVGEEGYGQSVIFSLYVINKSKVIWYFNVADSWANNKDFKVLDA